MCRISAENLFLWKKKQLLKGGDTSSLFLLLEILGGIHRDDLNSLQIHSNKILNLRKNLESIESIWDKHLVNSNPIQYLCGYTFWRNLKLKVSENVLIPRPETEILIDIVLNLFDKSPKKIVFAELGTGSGAISIALSLAKPLWNGIATDIDEKAIDIASSNFINYSDQSNLKFCCGHWWKPLKTYKGKLDLVISNPPYIPKYIYEILPKEVKNFEPKIALLGGEDGLEHIKEIIQYAPFYIKEKGWLILENHFDQGAKVSKLLQENRFKCVKVFKDLSGIERFTIGRYK